MTPGELPPEQRVEAARRLFEASKALGVPVTHLYFIDGQVVPSAAAMRALSTAVVAEAISTTIQAAASREDHP